MHYFIQYLLTQPHADNYNIIFIIYCSSQTIRNHIKCTNYQEGFNFPSPSVQNKLIWKSNVNVAIERWLIQNFHSFDYPVPSHFVKSTFFDFIDVVISHVGHQYCFKGIIIESVCNFFEKLHLNQNLLKVYFGQFLRAFVFLDSLVCIKDSKEWLTVGVFSQKTKLSKIEGKWLGGICNILFFLQVIFKFLIVDENILVFAVFHIIVNVFGSDIVVSVLHCFW